MKENSFLIIVWKVISLIAIVFFIFYYYDVKNMEKNQVHKKYVISDVSLRKRYGSSVGVNYNNNFYSIGLKKEEVLRYKEGDSISLYYNRKYDYFYVPNTLGLYLRYIYASIFSLLLSFIPWVKIKKNIDLYNKR